MQAGSAPNLFRFNICHQDHIVNRILLLSETLLAPILPPPAPVVSVDWRLIAEGYRLSHYSVHS